MLLALLAIPVVFFDVLREHTGKLPYKTGRVRGDDVVVDTWCGSMCGRDCAGVVARDADVRAGAARGGWSDGAPPPAGANPPRPTRPTGQSRFITNNDKALSRRIYVVLEEASEY